MSDYDQTTEDKLRKLVHDDPRYAREAYEFISETLAYTAQVFEQQGHVSGQQLCEGARRLAVERFGYLARTVLESWGIRRTADFGRLVYNMIEADLLRKSEEDSIEDFSEVYDFEQAFDRDFRIELEPNR